MELNVKGYNERGRAYRRHQRDRVVAKAKLVVSRWADADSVNREVFKSTLQEMAVAIDEIQPTNGTCILFTNHRCLDENVHDVYSGGELLDLEIPRGGGTKLGTALDWMENNGVQPDLTIAFTDGELSYSDLKKLVDNDVVIVLDHILSRYEREELEEAGARYIVAVDELKIA